MGRTECRAFQKVTPVEIPQNGTLEWWVGSDSCILDPSSRILCPRGREYKHHRKEIKTLQDYLTVELNKALNWARTLASYWYPTLNTDLEVHTPGANGGKSSFAVMRGNPMGTPLWVALMSPLLDSPIRKLQP